MHKPDPLIGTARDWTEDSAHENGNYANECTGCGKSFVGHKRRVICKVCAKTVETQNERRFNFFGRYWESRTVSATPWKREESKS